jgi:hypothetical protein
MSVRFSNLEEISHQAPMLLRCTNTWEEYGSNGWGPHQNVSIFSIGSLNAPHATKDMNRTSLAPITPEIREKLRQYYHDDYVMNDKIKAPMYDSSLWL